MSAKITDLVQTKEFTYSIEVTPDVTFDKINKLKIEPTFFSITWHAKSHGCEHLEIPPLKLARYLKSIGKNVCLHLSCDMLKAVYLEGLLYDLQNKGICNLFIILGENYDGSKSDFKSSKHLIEHIRERTGDYFCIGVAGYPDDPDSVKELKEKVDRGANFVLTQAFVKHYSLRIFEKQCEKLGITVPIIPGIFVFDKFKELEVFANICRIKISNDLMEYKNNETITGIGITEKLALEIIRSESGLKHVHLFTMNKFDKVQKLIKDVTRKYQADMKSVHTEGSEGSQALEDEDPQPEAQ